MVASDTMVGIIGAVVLTAALIGVFAYEATSETGTTATLKPITHSVTGSGTLSYTEAEEAPNCVPAPPVVECAPESTTVTFTAKGLPNIGSAMHYAGFLSGASGSPVFLGVLKASGSDYSLPSTTKDGDHRTGAFVVSLETSATPTSPSLTLFETNITGNSFSGEAQVSLAPNKDQELHINDRIGAADVSGELVNLPRYEGYVYRVWLHDNTTDGKFALLANVTMPESGALFNATLDARVTESTEGRWDHMMIYLESGDAMAAPAGFLMYKADLT